MSNPSLFIGEFRVVGGEVLAGTLRRDLSYLTNRSPRRNVAAATSTAPRIRRGTLSIAAPQVRWLSLQKYESI